jgi:hypothetical protein
MLIIPQIEAFRAKSPDPQMAYEAMQKIVRSINQVGKTLNVDPTGSSLVPLAIREVNVVGGGGTFQITITDNPDNRHPIFYFVDFDTDPSFPNPQTYFMGTTPRITITDADKSYYARVWNQYLGSDAGPLVVFTGTAGATEPVLVSSGSAFNGTGLAFPVQGTILDPSLIGFREDFWNSTNGDGAGIWQNNIGAGASNPGVRPGVFPNIGLRTFRVTVLNGGQGLVAGNGGPVATGFNHLIKVQNLSGWRMIAIFDIRQLGGGRLRVGFAEVTSTGTEVLPNRIQVQISPALNANIMLDNSAGGLADSGVPITTGYHRLEIYSEDPGRIKVDWDGNYIGEFDSTWFPTQPMECVLSFVATRAGLDELDLDFWSFGFINTTVAAVGSTARYFPRSA